MINEFLTPAFMFDSLTTVPEHTAIPVINELYNLLLYRGLKEPIIPREGQLNEEQKTLFLAIAKKLSPRYTDQHVRKLNDAFDKITGFTGVPKDERVPAESVETPATGENVLLISLVTLAQCLTIIIKSRLTLVSLLFMMICPQWIKVCGRFCLVDVKNDL